MADRTFVLGVGAQKAGTTWLRSYIENNKNARMGVVKEHHVWDAVYSPLCKNHKLHRSQLSEFTLEQYLRYHMQELPGFYEGYFNSILNVGYEITGDITPSYSALTENDFYRVKNKIKVTGAKIKCVFIMRDPVERCWSSVRHAMQDSEKVFDEQEYLIKQELYLRRQYSDEQFQFRTRYEIVCERLRKVFTEEELYFGFYETMFQDNELERLSEFLGVPVNYEHRNKYFKRSPKKSQISNTLYNEIRNFYSDTYDYCFKNFKGTRLIFNREFING